MRMLRLGDIGGGTIVDENHVTAMATPVAFMRMLRLGDIGDGTIVDENPLRDSARGTNSTTGEHCSPLLYVVRTFRTLVWRF